MMADDKDESLAHVGYAIYELLDNLAISRTNVPDHHEDFQTLELIINESDRFKIWSVSTGLLIPGHGSLDYRVREAESLSTILHAFLTDLRDNFEEVLVLGLHEAIQTEHGDAKYDSEGDDESDDCNVLNILLGSIKDINNCLFSLATKIRSPEARLRSSRAQNFQVLDDGVDLFDCFNEFELDFVSSLFRHLKKDSELVKDAERMDSPDEDPKISVDSEESGYLIERIAFANVARRRQFAYWKQHHLKLGEHTKAAVATRKASEPTEAANILPTPVDLAPIDAAPAMTISIATQLLNPTQDFNDLASMISVSEYMPSSVGEHADVVVFPPPPYVAADSKFFECPYCFTTCAKKTSKLKAWQAHLIHDLRPYICTYKDCKTPYQLYDAKADWIQHETTSHVISWKCPIHPNEALKDLVTFQLHTADGHLQNVAIEGSAQGAVVANPPNDAGRPCPVCSRSDLPAAQLNNHIASHLERLAIFSLPKHAGTAEAEDDGRNSNEADGERDSRGLDMKSALSFASSPVSLSSEHVLLEEHASPHSQSLIDKAEQLYLRTLAEREENLGLDHTSTIDAMHSLGILYAGHGKPLQAEQMYLQALAGWQRIYGPDSLSSHHTMTMLGHLYAEQRRLAEAEQVYTQVLTNEEKLHGPDHPDTLDALIDLGKLYRDRGDLNEAVQIFERVSAGREKVYGSEHNLTYDAVVILGALYQAQGRFGEAKQIYEQALVMYDYRLGENHQQALHMHKLLGSLLQEKEGISNIQADKNYRLFSFRREGRSWIRAQHSEISLPESEIKARAKRPKKAKHSVEHQMEKMSPPRKRAINDLLESVKQEDPLAQDWEVVAIDNGNPVLTKRTGEVLVFSVIFARVGDKTE